ncbi:hypothetical protein DFH07DRAFT_771971 [Mycena maculata]|uniref:Uncharacterized protein n=1 Tax=Mycena maculata TaxID=230809 RepID=A0AAD7JB43_9AGAR|nr:hypothetical protein DFH07DRAFT_771971 [Mycena maculata]
MLPIWPFTIGSDNSAHETHVKEISTVEIMRGRMGSHEPDIERPVSTPPFLHHPPPTQHPRAPQLLPSGVGQGVKVVSTLRREHGEARSRQDGMTGTIPVRQLEQQNSDLTLEVSCLMEEKHDYVTRINELENKIHTHLGQGTMAGPTIFGVALNLTSTADVRHMMEILEDEVHQTAATLADSDIHRQSIENPPGRQVADAERLTSLEATLSPCYHLVEDPAHHLRSYRFGVGEGYSLGIWIRSTVATQIWRSCMQRSVALRTREILQDGERWPENNLFGVPPRRISQVLCLGLSWTFSF